MKLFLKFTLFISAYLFISCSSGSEEEYTKAPKGKAIISGSFKNGDQIGNMSVIFPGKKPEKILISGNSFSDTLNVPYPLILTLTPIDRSTQKPMHVISIYLEPGFNVHFSVDLDDLYNTLDFKGLGQKENQYLLEKRKKIFKLYGFPPINSFTDEFQAFSDMLSLEENEFLTIMDSTRINLNESLDSTLLKETFKEYERKNIHYDFLATHYYYIARQTFNDKSYSGNPEIIKLFYEVDLTNDFRYFSSPSFATVAKYAFFRKNSDILKKVTKYNLRLNRSAFLAKRINKINNNVLRENLIKEIYPHLLAENNPESRDFYKEILKKSNISNQDLKNQIKNRYKQIKDFLPGNFAYDFKAITKEGALKQLSDFRGSPVLLQVWASWHKASIKEVLHMKILQNNAPESSHLKIVSVSIDDKKNNKEWIKTLNRLHLGGIQLKIQDNDINTFLERYNITDKLPKYILIDAKGMVAISDLPLPSTDPSFKDLILFDPQKRLEKAQEKTRKLFKK